MPVAGQVATGIGTYGVADLAVASRAAKPRGAVLDPLPPVRDYSEPLVVLGRLKPGRTRESLRVVHVFQLTAELLHDTVMIARCGEPLRAGDMQWLPGLTGMPCEQCVLGGLA
jgi:hypothetical protein